MPWKAFALFVLLAYGLAWLVTVPLWREGGLSNPLLAPLGFVMMATPAAAAVTVTLLVLRPAHPARFLGLVPVRPTRRLLGLVLLGFIGVQVLALLAVLLAAAVGAVTLTVSSEGLRSLALAPVFSALIAVPALGEELGWRGFLLPLLRPLGTWPALLITGVVWGLWHAPLILLGYNYGRTDALGLALMCVTTVLVGAVFGWLRMRSDSVWPSTFAHGALNASSGVFLAALLPAGQVGIAASLLGWVGWVLLGLVIVALAVGGTFRWSSRSAE